MKHSEETILRACLNQLFVEHRRICARCEVNLSTPRIMVKDLDNMLGMYNPKTKSISLARNLVLNHSWPIALEILKHQCAHQYVFEVRRRPVNEAVDHGNSFQEACGILRVHPDYRGNPSRLPRFLRTSDPEELKLMEKVEKLLALAQSSNRHEAALALEKAQLLIYKYNLNIIEQDTAQRHDCVVISSGKKKTDIWFHMIAVLLRDFFFVQAVTRKIYDPAVMKEFAAMELIGTDTNLSIAEYVFKFLLGKIDSLWKEYKKEHGSRDRIEEKSFKYGIMTGFREKMEKSRESRPDQAMSSKAIVESDKYLQDFIKERYPNIKDGRKRSVRGLSAYAYWTGNEQGKLIILHKPVNGSSENKGNMLGR